MKTAYKAKSDQEKQDMKEKMKVIYCPLIHERVK